MIHREAGSSPAHGIEPATSVTRRTHSGLQSRGIGRHDGERESETEREIVRPTDIEGGRDREKEREGGRGKGEKARESERERPIVREKEQGSERGRDPEKERESEKDRERDKKRMFD